MQFQWLNRAGNPDCILFMAGWSMALEPFQVLAAKSVDVLMVYDYRDLDDRELCAQLHNIQHHRLHLLAWSMGVWVAAQVLKDFCLTSPFSSATAIGGTCKPIDDKYGIPCSVFDEIINRFSPAGLTGFWSSMFDSKEQEKQFLNHAPARPVEELKQELISLRQACKQLPEPVDIFQHRIVTSRDRIFSPRNQIRAWGRKNCDTVALPHFPFYQWPDWAGVLDAVCR
jgi:biotin synthesis protein BioG